MVTLHALRSLFVPVAACALVASSVTADTIKPAWTDLSPFTMEGGLAAYWNVGEPTGSTIREAERLGFKPLTLINTFADYPGKQKENITNAIGSKPIDPWKKPPFFEKIVRQNIRNSPDSGVFVNDIEFDFEQDARKAWSIPAVRASSGAASLNDFSQAYLREWATWFGLPCKWVKEERPADSCGIYGVQPFRRDYWGIAGKSALQIDGAHARDSDLWRYIDPYVDFYVASIYVFYENPDSVYYMAANVEENYKTTRQFGRKPVMAYEWLRYHDAKGDEVAPYLAESMAIVPYFSGAKSVALWGYEPNFTANHGAPYQRLVEYTRGLARIARLSKDIGRGRLVIDTPAHQLWSQKSPLVRHVDTAPGECVIMAVNPWQAERSTSHVNVRCSGTTVGIDMVGRHVTLAKVAAGKTTTY